jgi:hypothetical protein
MAAPAYGTATGLGGASGSTANVLVPTTPAAGSGVVDLVFLYYEDSNTGVTPASGFTEAPDSPIVTNNFILRIYWKPATASSGTYNFTLPTSTWRECMAVRFTGADTTSPFDVTNKALDNASNTTSPAVSDTTTGPDRLWVHAVANFSGGTTTFGGGFTKNADAGEIAMATLAQAVAGASGSLTATHTTAAIDAAWLGALKPAGASNTGAFFAMF